MKKVIKYLLIAMAAMLSVSMSACSNDEFVESTDEDESLSQYPDDVEMYVTIKHKQPDDVYFQRYNMESSVWDYDKEQKEYYFFTFATREDEPRYAPIFGVWIRVPDKVKAGDIIPANCLSADNMTSSFICGPGVKDVVTGTIKVLKVTKNYYVLQFENVCSRHGEHEYCSRYTEVTINGTLKYERSELNDERNNSNESVN